MTQGVQDLIKAINSGDSTEIDSAFNAEMANRISTRLEDMRVSVAQGMFATEQSVEEDQVEEELTLEDYSVEEIQEFMQTEDFEQLDELSKKTVGNYASGRLDDLTDKGIEGDHDEIKRKHIKGLARATKRLGDKSIMTSAKKAIRHSKDFADNYSNMNDRAAYDDQDNMDDQKAKTHNKIEKAVDKSTKKSA